MEFSVKEQFQGFLATSQIFAENVIFEYPLYPALHLAPAKDLPEISEPAATVLGKRMEHFFTCYISHFSAEDVLVHNRQIIMNKETIGELDFLLKDPSSGEISHVELIYKFYLFDPDTGSSEVEHLIGPNKRDSLVKKLNRLQKNQFPLLFHEATRELLRDLNVDLQKVHQKMCFKASVFLPKKMTGKSFNLINPNTISGYWIKASEFTAEEYQESSFFMPSKKYWPVLPHINATWLSFEEIEQQIQTLLKNKFSPLLWMKTPAGEHKRLFVVWW